MKQSTKLAKVYLRQLSVSQKNPTTHKRYYNSNMTKKRWTVMKEIISKAKHSKKSNFSRKHKNGNKIKTGWDEIANEFNKYFEDIGPFLPKNITDSTMSFESFLKRINTILLTQSLSINEFKDAFFSLKQTKVLVVMK